MKLVQVSRVIHEKKGQDILLQALAMLKKDHGFQDFVVHIVGVGPSLDYLKQLAVTLDLKDQVVFCGGKDRPWLYRNLRQYHLLVQPSRYEGFGLTILEGFAAGLPVLASNIEGPAEIMRHTQRGELFEKEDVKGCAEKIWHFVEAYRNNRLKTIFEHHPPITDTEYSIQRCAEGYIDEYRSLLEKS
jgi:glycosyltransferase involved in cell wall biosynthesis